jgi:hypothetical protein
MHLKMHYAFFDSFSTFSTVQNPSGTLKNADFADPFSLCHTRCRTHRRAHRAARCGN